MRTSQLLIRRISGYFFPDPDVKKLFRLFFLLSFFKILWFDFSWCISSTFRPFSSAETYIYAILWSLILNMPVVYFRSVRTAWALDFLTIILYLSNLIYFRTYYTAIPLSSYGLVGNMIDFTDSVSGSLRWTDAVFPLSTLLAALFRYGRKTTRQPASAYRQSPLPYFLLITLFASTGQSVTLSKGGFRSSYEALQDSYTHTCGTVMYTIAGSVYYDYIRDKDIYTSATGQRIFHWIESHNAEFAPVSIQTRDNCILILVESLESWPIERTVEGQELTPFINKILRDSTTIYANRVLSQVKGGRSIDAQLIVNTGLLPINTGVYSLKYPYSKYPSIAGAMREKYGRHSVRATVLTADKPMVWNQSVIAPALGYDSLVSKSGFVQNETFGPSYRRQLGDSSLLQQCARKILRDSRWAEGGNLFQIITYSGHFPFILPEEMRRVAFTPAVPEMLRDYMTVVNYTDRALSDFVATIQADERYGNTLIVITGDHEGLGDMRDDFCRSAGARSIVSPAPFTPLIILNAPASIRYEKVMGQIDIYPTLLHLLGLTNYSWKGVGQSILDARTAAIAVDAHRHTYGDTSDTLAIRQKTAAWQISDEIIRYNYFGRPQVSTEE